MKQLTIKEVKDMDLATASAKLSNRVYEAALLLETLEYARRIDGNGHHLAQRVAEFAETLLKEHWNEEA